MPPIRICVSGANFLSLYNKTIPTFAYKFLVTLQILAQHQEMFIKTNFSIRLVMTSLFLLLQYIIIHLTHHYMEEGHILSLYFRATT